MRYFDYKYRKFFSGPHLLGSLLILAGLIALISPLLVTLATPLSTIIVTGISLLILGLFILISYEGTCLDLRNGLVKEYLSIAGYKKGHWIKMQAIGQIRLLSKTRRQTNTPNGVSPTLSSKHTVYLIILHSIESTSHTMYSFEYDDKKTAVKKADLLAAALNVTLISDL